MGQIIGECLGAGALRHDPSNIPRSRQPECHEVKEGCFYFYSSSAVSIALLKVKE
jgi:hypothetical protein